jgi:hypothetical protein
MEAQQENFAALAIALATAVVHDDSEALQSLVGDATRDRIASAKTIGALIHLFRIELAWHARERNTTEAVLIQDLGEFIANNPYDTNEPPEDWPSW